MVIGLVLPARHSDRLVVPRGDALKEVRKREKRIVLGDCRLVVGSTLMNYRLQLHPDRLDVPPVPPLS